jgi:hypothetical protein
MTTLLEQAATFATSAPTPSVVDTIFVDSSYTVNSGDTLDLAGGIGFKLQVRNHTTINLDIDGTVNVDGGGLWRSIGVMSSNSIHGDAAIHVGADGVLAVTNNTTGAVATGAFTSVRNMAFLNDGELRVTALAGSGAGVVDNSDSAILENTGSVSIEGGGLAYGLFSQFGGATLSNSGDITTVGAYSAGLACQGESSCTNDGLIKTFGVNSTGYSAGIVVLGGSATNNGQINARGVGDVVGIEAETLSGLTNTGVINAVSFGSTPSIGVLFSTDSGGGLVANDGVIHADVAFITNDAWNVGGVITNDVVINTGRVIGDVELGDGSDGVSNTGRIIGDVDMGDAGDIYIGNRGHLSGVIIGGLGNDNITTGVENDLIYGDEQDSSAAGGDDILRGMKGDDQLFGGVGTDTLLGGAGVDTLSGGDADDVFRFVRVIDSTVGAADLIDDLTLFDTIDLHRIDADTITGGDQAFHKVGAFTHAAGELIVSYDAGTNLTTIAGDVDGDGDADLVITATGDLHSFNTFIM